MGVFTLSNGIKIPDLCFGTGIVHKYRYGSCDPYHTARYWIKNFLKDRKAVRTDLIFPKVVNAAVEHGCCMFDTSRAYGGAEYILGKILKKYKREDYFVTTKLSNNDQFIGDIRKAFEKSLQELKLEYVDLYLIHWPVTGRYIKSWRTIENLYEEGLCRAIGVCNCNIHHLDEMRKSVNIMPMVDQFECHPLFTQNELRGYCRRNDIQVMAYTSTARMDERLNKTCLVPIAKKYHKSIAQIMLRWHQQIGNIPVVNSTNVDHFIENTEIYDIDLTDEEIEKISKVNINSRLRYDPDNCDFSQL